MWARVMLSACVVLAGPAWGQAPAPGIEATYAEHTRAVELARAGRYDEGLEILARLLARSPGDYPLARDYIIILTWKDNCSEALERFGRIPSAVRLEAYFIRAVADCGVRAARAGDYDAGLDALERLLRHDPGNYPLARDITLITIWKGDCRGALARFERIRASPDLEPYLIVPVADCLLAAGRPREAAALVNDGLARYPREPSLEHARLKAEVALRLDARLDENRPEAALWLASDESDQGLRELLGQAEAGVGIAPRLRLQARYLVTRSSDAEFRNGDLHRLGLGVGYRIDARSLVLQEFSRDTRRGGKGGSDTRLVLEPYDTWRYVLRYATYTEDIPLRARANDIEARRAEGGAEYHSSDYVWHWRATVNRYDFSDGNDRRSFFTTAGYAFEMLPYREQRLFLEWYRSRNTLDGAPYFNPARDSSLGLVHKTDFVYDTRFKRRVDRLYLLFSVYRQAGFAARTRWGIKYEQDYDFDQANALVVSAAFRRNAYDGAREDETRLELYYRRRF